MILWVHFILKTVVCLFVCFLVGSSEYFPNKTLHPNKKKVSHSAEIAIGHLFAYWLLHFCYSTLFFLIVSMLWISNEI